MWLPSFRKRTMTLILLISAKAFGFPSIINQFVWHPPFRKRTMASILFARWTPNHNRRLIDGFSTAQRQHSKSPVRKVPCFSGRTLSLHILYCIFKDFLRCKLPLSRKRIQDWLRVSLQSAELNWHFNYYMANQQTPIIGIF